jgi:hypothetical protein
MAHSPARVTTPVDSSLCGGLEAITPTIPAGICLDVRDPDSYAEVCDRILNSAELREMLADCETVEKR